MPVGPEPKLGKRLVGEARPDGFFGDGDDGLAQSLIMQLVQRHEHQRTALTRCGRGLDQQILLAALLISALLHRSHAQFIRFGRIAILGVGNGYGGGGFLTAHRLCFHSCIRFLQIIRSRHLSVEFEQLLQSLRVVLEAATDIDSLKHFIVAFMGGTQIGMASSRDHRDRRLSRGNAPRAPDRMSSAQRVRSVFVLVKVSFGTWGKYSSLERVRA